MSVITRRLSIPELSQQILAMAKTGVYRESVFEALQPMATKKQIALAIAHAKRFGLHSVASLRDDTLGTYYQVDLVKYQALEHAIATPTNLGNDDDLLERVMATTSAMQQMLAIAGGLAVTLGLAGAVCLVSDWHPGAIVLFSSAAITGSLWAIQRTFLQRLP